MEGALLAAQVERRPELLDVRCLPRVIHDGGDVPALLGLLLDELGFLVSVLLLESCDLVV